MASNGSSRHQSRLVATAGLILSTGGLLLSEALITLLQRRPDEIAVFLCVHVHAHVFFLNPLTFYLGMLLLLSLVAVHAAAPETPLGVFINKHLARAAHSVCLANLLSSAPLLLHVSVVKESVGFAIAASLSVLALIAIFASALKKNMILSCRAGRGFKPALFALCISTGKLISLDLLSSFSNKNHHDFLIAIIPVRLLFSLVSFFAFILSITLLLLRICARANGPRVMIRSAENWVISPLCVAIASIIIDWYMKVYMEVTGMGTAVPVEPVQFDGLCLTHQNLAQLVVALAPVVET